MKDAPYVSTTNACKMCTPLGASLAFKGVEGCVPFLHGSQGCATYMRRYVISHFREPVDIASSALGEKHAVYGGGPNLKKGVLNVMQKYGAKIVGVASTCLTETIGDDLSMLVKELFHEFGELDLPYVVWVSTPSYSGTHMDGFHGAVKALVDQLTTEKTAPQRTVNVMPGLVSPADMRHIKDIAADYGVGLTLLPDFSETLDGPALEDYVKIPDGGATIEQIQAMSGSLGSIECGAALETMKTAGDLLEKRFGVPTRKISLPIGIRGSDAFFDAMNELTGQQTPRKHALERGRLVDAMVDGHKYVFHKRAVIYGDEDLALALASFSAEIGVLPVLVATGAKSKHFSDRVLAACKDLTSEPPMVIHNADFHEIAEAAQSLSPDFLLGNSKAQRYARQWNRPLIRVGFPIHDRFGGQRTQHVGYSGTLALYDRIVNTMLERKQSASPVGYGYM